MTGGSKARGRFVLLALALSLLLGFATDACFWRIAQQTESGQDFDFVFPSVPPSDGTDGTLTIHARGDYQPDNPTEYLTWDLDFMGIGSFAGPVTGEAIVVRDNGINDVQWFQSFTIHGDDLLEATSDSTLHVFVDLYLDDQFLGVNHLADTEWVKVTIRYKRGVPDRPGDWSWPD